MENLAVATTEELENRIAELEAQQRTKFITQTAHPIKRMKSGKFGERETDFDNPFELSVDGKKCQVVKHTYRVYSNPAQSAEKVHTFLYCRPTKEAAPQLEGLEEFETFQGWTQLSPKTHIAEVKGSNRWLELSANADTIVGMRTDFPANVIKISAK